MMHNQCGNGQNRNARTHDDDDNASFDPCTVTAHLPVHSLVDAKSLCHILQFNSGIILTTTACCLALCYSGEFYRTVEVATSTLYVTYTLTMQSFVSSLPFTNSQL